MYNNSVTLLVNIVDITTMYCAMYIIHIIYIAMYIILYCAYEAICIHVYTAMYVYTYSSSTFSACEGL